MKPQSPLDYLWPQQLLDDARMEVNQRKLRLLACALAREQWQQLSLEVSRKAIETAEAFADGQASRQELETIRDEAALLTASLHQRELQESQELTAFAARLALATTHEDAYTAANLGTLPGPEQLRTCIKRELYQRQLFIMHDLLDGHLLNIKINPEWLWQNEENVQQLAEVIYRERTFDLMPILADALEDAGCTDSRILDHCREQCEHFLGCWVLDLLLGNDAHCGDLKSTGESEQ